MRLQAGLGMLILCAIASGRACAATTERVRVSRSGGARPTVVYEYGFESGLGGWTVDNGIWQVGTPTVGPLGAHGGVNCATTGLNGNYPAGGISRLVSPEVTLPNVAAGQEIWLRYWAWFNYDRFDQCEVSLRVKNFDSTWGDWSNVAVVGDPYHQDQVSPWSRLGLDLTGYAGQSIQFGFQHHADASGERTGLYVDDVSVVAEVPVFVEREGFEGGWAGWVSDHGVWAVGSPLYGPGAAHSGTQCVGTYLPWAAVPPIGSHSRLISPTFHLPTLGAGETITVRVAEWWWWGSGPRPNFIGGISVQDPATKAWGDWTALGWDNPHSADTSGGWISNRADLTSYAGKAVRLGFEFGYDHVSATARGYYIDDVVIEMPLHSEFGAVPTEGTAPFEVHFSDLAMGGPTTWMWDFGDGGTSTLQNPSHVYATPGSYDVSLTVGKGGEWDTETKTGYITVYFQDVDSTHWACSYVGRIAKAGITTGCDATHYCPANNVTRSQMALFLGRAMGGLATYTPATCGSERFDDVPCDYLNPGNPPSAFYKGIEYIADAAHNSLGRAITLGCDADNYCPEAEVTRGQMALFLGRAIGGLDAYTAPTCGAERFDDVPCDYLGSSPSAFYTGIEYIADAAHNAIGRAITLGCDATHYCPTQPVRRDQMAAFLARAFLGME